MKKHNSAFLILLFLSSHVLAQNSNFEKGYKEGFTKGYCFNQPVTCIEKAPAFTPTTKFNESNNSYQDGYNRGFADGLGHRHTQTATTITNQIEAIKFNEYKSQLQSNSINTLAYKEKIYSERKVWITSIMDDVHAFLNKQFLDLDEDEAKKWYDSMLDFQNKLGIKFPDLSQESVFNPIKSFLTEYTVGLIQVYNKIKSEADANTIHFDISKYENTLPNSSLLVDFYPDVYGKWLCNILWDREYDFIEKGLKVDNSYTLSMRNSDSGSLHIIYLKKYDSYYHFFSKDVIKKDKVTSQESESYVMASMYRAGGHGNPIFIRLSDYDSDYIILDKGNKVSANYLGVVRFRLNIYDKEGKLNHISYNKAKCWQDKDSGKKYFLNVGPLKSEKILKDELLITSNLL